ncbi:hypothetical protein [Aquibacillus kalidii]|uniref:hypothetical protein n=1 Tax=Aquibacillus kalidii TaxID=2762597 RepID=UPI001647E499|nr:hypothetical protein [Aquibacillus kalidii]
MINSIIALGIVAVFLFVISFFLSDKFKQLEDQLEQVSITSLQETYQIKKKIKVLEEELLADDSLDMGNINTQQTQTPLIRRINHMHKQGHSINEIAKRTNLSEYDVNSIVHQFSQES